MFNLSFSFSFHIYLDILMEIMFIFTYVLLTSKTRALLNRFLCCHTYSARAMLQGHTCKPYSSVIIWKRREKERNEINRTLLVNLKRRIRHCHTSAMEMESVEEEEEDSGRSRNRCCDTEIIGVVARGNEIYSYISNQTCMRRISGVCPHWLWALVWLEPKGTEPLNQWLNGLTFPR